MISDNGSDVRKYPKRNQRLCSPHSFPTNIQLQNGSQSKNRFRYKKIKQTLNYYDNLPNALKHFSLLSTLQCLGEL